MRMVERRKYNYFHPKRGLQCEACNIGSQCCPLTGVAQDVTFTKKRCAITHSLTHYSLYSPLRQMSMLSIRVICLRMFLLAPPSHACCMLIGFAYFDIYSIAEQALPLSFFFSLSTMIIYEEERRKERKESKLDRQINKQNGYSAGVRLCACTCHWHMQSRVHDPLIPSPNQLQLANIVPNPPPPPMISNMQSKWEQSIHA